VTASGDSATYSGPGLQLVGGWPSRAELRGAGKHPDGEAVVAAMEKSLPCKRRKPLAERLLAALAAATRPAETAADGSRGAPRLPAKGGYNGFTERAVDVRVDDHADPFHELSRLVGMGVVNDLWNAAGRRSMGDGLRGAEVAGAGDDPRRSPSRDAPRGGLRPRRHRSLRGTRTGPSQTAAARWD